MPLGARRLPEVAGDADGTHGERAQILVRLEDSPAPYGDLLPRHHSVFCPTSRGPRTPPNRALQRTRPAATDSGNMKIPLGGPVR